MPKIKEPISVQKKVIHFSVDERYKSNVYKTKTKIMSLCINCKKYGNCPGQVEGKGAWDQPIHYCPGGYIPKEIIKYDEK